jgi:hypothetical protein
MIIEHLLERLAVADDIHSRSHHAQIVRLSLPFFWSHSCVGLASMVAIIIAAVARRTAPPSLWRPIASAGTSAVLPASHVALADVDAER